MAQLAALIYIVISIGIIIFQICLIFGAPWGSLTQGGFHPGKLPRKNRIAAAVSCVLILVMGLAIGSAAGHWPNWPVWTSWIALAMTVLSAVLNVLTPSRSERLLWGPTTLVMLGLALVVML